jgi:uncharacterized protein YsxB (DUF464 family)
MLDSSVAVMMEKPMAALKVSTVAARMAATTDVRLVAP